MSKVTKRQVYYFDEPGKGNTRFVIEAVSRRLEAGGIKKVIIASTSGETAAKFARRLKDKVELICVSEAPYLFHNSVLEAARWSEAFPERLVKETLYCFGQGMKVAVEVALTAVSCGYVTPYQDVIGVGGSGKGADTAIILRATYPSCVFDKDPTKRLEIKEVIAMPISKKWWE